MAGRSQIRGVLNFLIEDQPYRFELNSINIGLGGQVLTPVDNCPGEFTGSFEPASISVGIKVNCEDSVTLIKNICDQTITVDEFQGRVWTLRNATATVTGESYSPETGVLTVTFYGGQDGTGEIQELAACAT